MLVGVLTLGVVTTASMIGMAAQPPARTARPVVTVRPALSLAAPLARVVDLHVVREPKTRVLDDFVPTVEDPLIGSKRRAFAETGRDCRIIGGQRCLSKPRTLLTLR